MRIVPSEALAAFRSAAYAVSRSSVSVRALAAGPK